MIRGERDASSLVTMAIMMAGFVSASPVLAAELAVPSPNYPTIQAAIDDASPGDEVVIAPGTYQGSGNRDIDFLGKAITVRSTDPNDPNVVAATVIKCNPDDPNDPDDPNYYGYHRGFYFDGGEDANSVLAGLTITDGYGDGSRGGGGIYCDYSSPTIMRCNITGNTSLGSGGGIYCNSSSSMITGCTISNNSTGNRGGGIFCTYGNPTIVGCTVNGNYALQHGGIRCAHNSPMITNCLVMGNQASSHSGGLGLYQADVTVLNSTICMNSAGTYGGGLQNSKSSPTFINCTLSGNSAGTVGGAVHFISNSLPSMTNCIVWGNIAPVGPQIALVDISGVSSLSLSCTDLQGGPNEVYVEAGCTLNWGTGNIVADPRFIDPNGPDGDPNTWEDNDYHLSLQSPCISLGDPNGVYAGQTDIDGEARMMGPRVDIGSDEVPYTTIILTVTHPEWGEVTLDPDQPTYEPNTVVTLRAMADEGKAWMGWDGDVPSEQRFDNPLIVVVNGPMRVSTAFKCGFGVGPVLPLIAAGLVGLVALRRRWWW